MLTDEKYNQIHNEIRLVNEDFLEVVQRSMSGEPMAKDEVESARVTAQAKISNILSSNNVTDEELKNFGYERYLKSFNSCGVRKPLTYQNS